MIYFNREFESSYSPSTDEKIIGEFKHAHQLARGFSPGSATVENCFEKIQQCFSVETREKYGPAVQLFLKAAKNELDERIRAVGTSTILCETSKQTGTEQQAISTTKESPETLNSLGMRYLLGKEAPLNEAEAIRLLKLAADQGYAKAQYNLRRCYDQGKGVSQDWNEAVRYCRLAADQGLAIAQGNLGFYYAEGRGVRQDWSEAVRYYKLAADQGEPIAQTNLGRCYGLGKGVLQDWREAVRYFKLAADQGEAIAQYFLASCYEQGNGVSKDWSEVVRYCRLAADQGEPQAQRALGKCYVLGKGVPQDRNIAIEYYKCAIANYKYMDPSDRILLLYKSESLGFLEQIISSSPLSTLPTELLIRFLGSKPFAVTKVWLEETIAIEEAKKTRLETLSAEQKTAILSRFTRYEYAMPLIVWMDLFHVTEEEVRNIASSSPYAEPPPLMRTPDFLDEQRVATPCIIENLDVYDPFTILLFAKDTTISFSSVIEHVKMATLALFTFTPCETVICGGRTFLSWGDARPESSPCTTQNDIPLHGTYQGKPITLYPRGVFNDLFFGVAAVALRRKIYEWVVKLVSAEDKLDPEVDSELSRLAEHLVERYSQLPALLAGRENPPVPGIRLPKELQRAETFASLLKGTYQLLTRRYQEALRTHPNRPVYDPNNPVHRHAFLYLALLILVREAKVTHEKGVTQITLSRNVLFRLKSLSLAEFKVSPEDNPGITNLASYASDYPLHTLSPITPSEITPETFERFIAEVQSLNDITFDTLCDSCKAFMAHKMSDEVPYEAYFQAWHSLWPRSVQCETAALVMTRLAKNYYGHVDAITETLSPNQRYLLDPRGVGRFSKEEEVPAFVRPLGSFASALCKFFIPYDSQCHDGDCAVNCFLMGIHGHRTYAERQRDLSRDIQEFRAGIVEYATSHFNELKAEFGEEATSELISHYRRPTGYESWTTSEVWAIAARKYGRIINIFTCNTSDNYFKTNDQGVVVPFHEDHEIIKPQKPSSKAPINLLLWGPHYCFLQKK